MSYHAARCSIVSHDRVRYPEWYPAILNTVYRTRPALPCHAIPNMLAFSILTALRDTPLPCLLFPLTVPGTTRMTPKHTAVPATKLPTDGAAVCAGAP